jgi:hypothetical protein
MGESWVIFPDQAVARARPNKAKFPAQTEGSISPQIHRICTLQVCYLIPLAGDQLDRCRPFVLQIFSWYAAWMVANCDGRRKGLDAVMILSQ